MKPCTACDDGRCEESFTCLRCGEKKNSCRHRVGGFDADWDLCERCYEDMTLPVAVLAYIRRRFDRKKSVEGVA